MTGVENSEPNNMFLHSNCICSELHETFDRLINDRASESRCPSVCAPECFYCWDDSPTQNRTNWYQHVRRPHFQQVGCSHPRGVIVSPPLYRPLQNASPRNLLLCLLPCVCVTRLSTDIRAGNNTLKTRSANALTARSRQGNIPLPPFRFLRKMQLT